MATCSFIVPRFRVRANRRRASMGRFLSDDRAQAATEYILVIGLVVVFIAVSYNAIQESLKALLARLLHLLNGPGI